MFDPSRLAKKPVKSSDPAEARRKASNAVAPSSKKQITRTLTSNEVLCKITRYKLTVQGFLTEQDFAGCVLVLEMDLVQGALKASPKSFKLTPSVQEAHDLWNTPGAPRILVLETQNKEVAFEARDMLRARRVLHPEYQIAHLPTWLPEARDEPTLAFWDPDQAKVQAVVQAAQALQFRFSNPVQDPEDNLFKASFWVGVGWDAWGRALVFCYLVAREPDERVRTDTMNRYFAQFVDPQMAPVAQHFRALIEALASVSKRFLHPSDYGYCQDPETCQGMEVASTCLVLAMLGYKGLPLEWTQRTEALLDQDEDRNRNLPVTEATRDSLLDLWNQAYYGPGSEVRIREATVALNIMVRAIAFKNATRMHQPTDFTLRQLDEALESVAVTLTSSLVAPTPDQPFSGTNGPEYRFEGSRVNVVLNLDAFHPANYDGQLLKDQAEIPGSFLGLGNPDLYPTKLPLFPAKYFWPLTYDDLRKALNREVYEAFGTMAPLDRVSLTADASRFFTPAFLASTVGALVAGPVHSMVLFLQNIVLHAMHHYVHGIRLFACSRLAEPKSIAAEDLLKELDSCRGRRGQDVPLSFQTTHTNLFGYGPQLNREDMNDTEKPTRFLVQNLHDCCHVSDVARGDNAEAIVTNLRFNLEDNEARNSLRENNRDKYREIKARYKRAENPGASSGVLTIPLAVPPVKNPAKAPVKQPAPAPAPVTALGSDLPVPQNLPEPDLGLIDTNRVYIYDPELRGYVEITDRDALATLQDAQISLYSPDPSGNMVLLNPVQPPSVQASVGQQEVYNEIDLNPAGENIPRGEGPSVEQNEANQQVLAEEPRAVSDQEATNNEDFYNLGLQGDNQYVPAGYEGLEVVLPEPEGSEVVLPELDLVYAPTGEEQLEEQRRPEVQALKQDENSFAPAENWEDLVNTEEYYLFPSSDQSEI